MDPNGSYTSEDYICYVSPLHEALRGTTAMPTLEQFQNSMPFPTTFMNSISITPGPEKEAMLSAEYSTFPYHMDVAFPPPILSSSCILAAPADNTSSTFLADFTVSVLEIYMVLW
jgi:hypothetical protein